jgi:2-polyprenyl-6-hydroxyphenyl methylase/3-demethylubiquinone-9 3-methyltransferase
MNASVAFGWQDGAHTAAHSYLLPAVKRLLERESRATGRRQALFDVGCGNGSVARAFAAQGWDVVGVDADEAGIRQPENVAARVRLFRGSAYDDLGAIYGRFPVVLSLEVVEHLYDPRRFARTIFELLEPDGLAVISTPYHGYWKNLLIALSGRFDQHFTALWDHGHIKFWSVATLSQLLQDAGFKEIEALKVGRIPPIAKSMILTARKPVLSD